MIVCLLFYLCNYIFDFCLNFLEDSSGLPLCYQAASLQIVFHFDKYMVTYYQLLTCTVHMSDLSDKMSLN